MNVIFHKMKNSLNKSDILDRIKQHYKILGNGDLSKFLGISPSTLSNWYNRNSIDIDIIFTKCENVDFNWLLTGTGEMLRQPASPTPKPYPSVAPFKQSIMQEPSVKPFSKPTCVHCAAKDAIIADLRTDKERLLQIVTAFAQAGTQTATHYDNSKAQSA